MRLAFTRYVRALDSGEEPAAKPEEEAWRKLADALKREMRERGLWLASPGYLGMVGAASWAEEEVFEELLCDCYSFVFVDRIGGLSGLLGYLDNIEGVVFRNIRFFLFERQKLHDPVGYRIFVVSRKAARAAIRKAWLFVLQGDDRVSNDTILGFELLCNLPRDRVRDFGPQTSLWSAELLPGLVTARGARLERVCEELEVRLRNLASPDVQWFRFRELVEPFKSHVRQMWSEMWRSSRGETAFEEGDRGAPELVFLTWPEAGFEQDESFEQLSRCVEEGLARFDGRQKTREYLERLWIFLQTYADDKGSREIRGPGQTSDPPGSQCLPSHRKIAEQLEIPRYRMPELFESLGQMVKSCSTAVRNESHTPARKPEERCR